MFHSDKSPKEGDIYKTVKIDDHVFELKFGYYADFERELGEPVVIYPDLSENKLYTKNGSLLVTAIQDPCAHYEAHDSKQKNECCGDCIHYIRHGDEIGVCGRLNRNTDIIMN
ncbi:MAG: hypothetical protein IJB49_03790 [Clostridia bacterium]|nr:hypothetical protein [Clostridia bacterium]